MDNFKHSLIDTNGIKLHIAEKGEGPLVIMCHGFPGLCYSWRHQIEAFANAGYRAVAMDQRGYGQSDRPLEVKDYGHDVILKDMLGLQDALGEETAVWIGQDFGSPIAWNMAVRHSERVAAVASLCVSYDSREMPSPLSIYASIAKKHFIHFHYFQEIGPPEKEFYDQPELFLTRLYWALSGEGSLLDWEKFPSEGNGYLDVLADPAIDLPWSWLEKEDMDYIVSEFMRGDEASACIGGLNSYRAADINWELSKPYIGSKVEQPAFFMAGAEDPALQVIGMDQIDRMKALVPDLRGSILVPGAGHHVQQEAHEIVSKELIGFLNSLNL